MSCGCIYFLGNVCIHVIEQKITQPAIAHLQLIQYFKKGYFIFLSAVFIKKYPKSDKKKSFLYAVFARSDCLLLPVTQLFVYNKKQTKRIAVNIIKVKIIIVH